jgi:hypothetical protein
MFSQSNSKVSLYSRPLTFCILDVTNNDLGASVGLENDNDLFLWNVIFEGPSDTLYEVSSSLGSCYAKMHLQLKAFSHTCYLGWFLQGIVEVPFRLSQ